MRAETQIPFGNDNQRDHSQCQLHLDQRFCKARFWRERFRPAMSDESSSRELEVKLPVHGFVLAGGKSSRMGRDKALLEFRGRPMVEIAVEKLRAFCAVASIAGNREDLSGFAPVVPEERVDCGPAAGIEAGLRACTQPWAMFIPVDVPLAPAELLRRWAAAVLANPECAISYLVAGGSEQPTFCLLRTECLRAVSEAVEDGERRVRNLFWVVESVGRGRMLWVCDAEDLAGALLDNEYPNLQIANWFKNVNTPDEHLFAEAGFGPE